MSMTIGHNLGAMNALSALNSNSNALNSALQQLSTGKRINSAADDASGYAISQKMQGQINGLNQASSNAQDGISMIQTASGALSQTTSILQQMRQLAVQASNSTATDADRADLQTEFNQLASQINNIGNTTQFNTQDLLNGGIGSSVTGNVTQASAATWEAGSSETGYVTAGVQATQTGGTFATDASSNGATLTVDGESFNIDSIMKAASATAAATAAGSIKSADGTSLSSLVSVTASGSSLKFTGVNNGDSLSFSGLDSGAQTNVGASGATLSVTGLTSAAAQDLSGSGATTGASITVNGQTFDLSNVLNQDFSNGSLSDVINALNGATSGQTKLSDVATISNDNGNIKIVDKSTGSSSSITVNAGTGTDADAIGAMFSLTNAADLAAKGTVTGTPSTVTVAGLQATNTATSTAGSLTSADNFSISIGGGAAQTVSFTGTTNVSSAQDVANALNGALQQAGLSGSVTAAVGYDSSTNKYDKIQLVSQNGQDISISGLSSNFSSLTGFTGSEKPTNVNEVVGTGAVGTGFTATFQIGANSGQTMQLTIGDMRAAALGISSNAGAQGYSATNNVTDGTDSVNTEAALDITTTTSADNSIKTIDNAIQTVTTEQANLGAVQNRLTSTISNLSSTSQNLTTAESGITDTDMASEMATFTQDNVLQQAAVSMLAQANQQPQLVLKLLG